MIRKQLMNLVKCEVNCRCASRFNDCIIGRMIDCCMYATQVQNAAPEVEQLIGDE